MPRYGGYEPIGEERGVRTLRRFLEHWSSAVLAVLLCGLAAGMLGFVFIYTIDTESTGRCYIKCCVALCNTLCTSCINMSTI